MIGRVNGGSIFPIGSIYLTVSELNPETYFGGKWEKIAGRFLLGADPSQYVFMCYEGETFTLTAKARCRYGVGDSWVEKTLEKGTYKASLSTFGGTDPAFGKSKVVEVRLDAGVAAGQDTLGIYPSSFEARGYSLSTGGGFSDRAIVSDAQNGFQRKYRPPFFTVYMWRRIA